MMGMEGALLAFAREAGFFFFFCGEIFTIVVECEEVESEIREFFG